MDRSKEIGFGILGLGMIAEFHFRAIAEIGGCRFAAGFDTVPGRAAEFCKKHGGRAYDNLDAFLSDRDIDIVTIATPSGLHLDGAVAAARAGKHIIVEKPLEISRARCDTIIAEAEAAGVKAGVVFPSRYHGPSKIIKKAIEGGRLGTIVLADAQIKWYRSQEYYDSGKWRGTWQFDGGGALMNQGIHAIDLLQWFMGDVSEVSAQTATLAHERIEVEDTAAAVLKFANGAVGVIEGTTAAWPGFLKKIEICGSKGSIIMEEESITTWKFAEELPEDGDIRKRYGGATATGGGAADPAAIGHHGHKMLFESFVQALREDQPPDIDGVEGRKAVEIIEAIYRSAKSRAPVALPLKA
ncbi:MAG: Gfo/Idh/MocA family oxidoreductase [Treponema sp.]|jgi:predicted dehydrogenase|nr:Gfo/Idh/MocA family oxidoreductase [Treponema sp.]